MKKYRFYTLHKIGSDPVQAVMHDGYTDGRYFYYRNSSRVWFACCMETGVSIVRANTRKAAQAAVHADAVQTSLRRAKNSPAWERWCRDFCRLVNDRIREV